MSEKKLYTVEEASNLSIDKIHQLYKEFINPNQTDIYKSLPFGNDVFDSAEGVHIFSSDGKKILDFTGGLGVLGLGHNHPKILEARINYQIKKKIEEKKIIFSKYMAALSSSISYLLPENLKKSFFLIRVLRRLRLQLKYVLKRINQKRNLFFSQINLITEN